MSTAGWPSTTGNPSGGGRDNNLSLFFDYVAIHPLSNTNRSL